MDGLMQKKQQFFNIKDHQNLQQVCQKIESNQSPKGLGILKLDNDSQIQQEQNKNLESLSYDQNSFYNLVSQNKCEQQIQLDLNQKDEISQSQIQLDQTIIYSGNKEILKSSENEASKIKLNQRKALNIYIQDGSSYINEFTPQQNCKGFKKTFFKNEQNDVRAQIDEEKQNFQAKVDQMKQTLKKWRLRYIAQKMVSQLEGAKFIVFQKQMVNQFLRDKTYFQKKQEILSVNVYENRKMVQKLKTPSQGGKQQLNQFDIQQDNDYQQQKQKQLYQKKFQKCILQLSWNIKIVKRNIYNKIMNTQPVDPNKKFSIICDIIDVIQIVYQFMLVTMTTLYGLNLENNSLFLQISRTLSIIYLIFDMFMQFNKGFYKNGKLILDRNLIFKNYIKGQFMVDSIGLMVLIFAQYGTSEYTNTLIGQMLQWFFFVKCYTLLIIFQRLEYLLYLYGWAGYTYSLLKMLVNMLVICHWIGVSYYLLGLIEVDSGIKGNWIEVNQMQQEEWYMRYIVSFYFAMATMMLIGTRGETFFEITYLCLLLSVTVGVFGYLIGNINLIITEMNEKSKNYKDELKQINIYMKDYNLQEQIKTKVRGVLEHIHRIDHKIQDSKKVQNIISKLPLNLQSDIKLEIQMKVLKQFDFFNLFSQETQEKVAQLLEEKFYVTNQQLYQYGDVEKQKLYLIMSGKVALFRQIKKGKEEQKCLIRELEKGQIFGEISFLTENNQQDSAVCQNFVTLYELDLQKFLKEIQNRGKDYERFKNIKEEILHNGFSKIYKRQCSICNQFDHLEKECRICHYHPYKNIYLAKYNYYPKITQRQIYKRNINKKSLLYQQSINWDDINFLLQKHKEFQQINQITQDELQNFLNDLENDSDYYFDEYDQQVYERNYENEQASLSAFTKYSTVEYVKNNPNNFPNISQKQHQNMQISQKRNSIQCLEIPKYESYVTNNINTGSNLNSKIDIAYVSNLQNDFIQSPDQIYLNGVNPQKKIESLNQTTNLQQEQYFQDINQNHKGQKKLSTISNRKLKNQNSLSGKNFVARYLNKNSSVISIGQRQISKENNGSHFNVENNLDNNINNSNNIQSHLNSMGHSYQQNLDTNQIKNLQYLITKNHQTQMNLQYFLKNLSNQINSVQNNQNHSIIIKPQEIKKENISNENDVQNLNQQQFLDYESFFLHFDSAQNYSYYYPKFNLKNLVLRHNLNLKEKLQHSNVQKKKITSFHTMKAHRMDS